MKKYKKLLNEYYLRRTLFEECFRNYNCSKTKARQFLKFENQTKEYKAINHSYETPLTRMNSSDIRRINADECKKNKQLLFMAHHRFSVAEKKLLDYIKEYKGLL